MNLADSCGWLEYFADGPNAAFFAKPLEETDEVIVPTICILEVFKRLLQQRGEDIALQAVAVMQQCIVVELDVALALQAAKISAHYGLPLADSVILSVAQRHNASIWTQKLRAEQAPPLQFYNPLTPFIKGEFKPPPLRGGE